MSDIGVHRAIEGKVSDIGVHSAIEGKGKVSDIGVHSAIEGKVSDIGVHSAIEGKGKVSCLISLLSHLHDSSPIGTTWQGIPTLSTCATIQKHTSARDDMQRKCSDQDKCSQIIITASILIPTKHKLHLAK